MLNAEQRHIISVTFFPTSAHTLAMCIEAAGFTDTSKDSTYSIRHNQSDMEYFYPYGQIHEPRDDGNGVTYNYFPE